MSLDTVVEDIRDDARARAEEIRAEGERRADEIVSEAEADAEEIIETAEQDAQQEIEREREQRLSSAKLEAKQARLEARREALQDVREQAGQAVAAIDGDEREELTRTLLDAAATEFEDASTVEVYGRGEDADLLESILEEYDGFELAGETECLGGVVVEAEESRVRVNNTFDSVLEDVWEDNLKTISEELFEER
ncbi:V-type ATP synthase subunit E [Halosegnis longus]|uniref:A-type ATP synthase subunit E n=1 Tax=Halosegnis longus TaxID=2216012 RepID=A0AAJ4R9W0_9EURY|nr:MULTISPECIES: V-type ATP synthase subunit E [Halobacteriales]RNJ27256.1 V-type ATP synthase subunit E [Salella cibi]